MLVKLQLLRCPSGSNPKTYTYSTSFLIQQTLPFRLTLTANLEVSVNAQISGSISDGFLGTAADGGVGTTELLCKFGNR